MSEDRDWEAEAKAGGWQDAPDHIPEDKRVDAKTFVERGEKIAGIQKSKADRLEARIEEMSSTFADFQQHHQRTLAKERQQARDRIAELEAERAQAITEGDGTRFTKLDQELNDLKSAEPVGKAELDPLAQAWVTQNQWYATDDILNAYADGISERVSKAGYTGQAYFNELTRRVKEAFPEKFKNPARSQPGVVETESARESDDPKPKSYQSLPSDAKSMCEKFVRTIPGFTKEQFLAEYDWE